MGPQTRRITDRVQLGHVKAGLALVVCGSILAVGAVHIPVALACAGASAALGCWAFRQGPLPRAATVPVCACLALACVCILQAIPLPRPLVSVLSPQALYVWDQSLRPLGRSAGSWVSLSLDPGASWVEAAKWGGFSAIVATAARLGQQRGGLNFIILTILGCGVLSAAIALFHRVLDIRLLYGIYEPKLAVTPWRVSPLLNPNNFAGYLNFSAMLGLGLLVGRRSPAPRPLLGLALIFVLAVSLLTGSRGATASFLCGLGLLLIQFYRTRSILDQRARNGWVGVGMVASVAAGAIALAWIGGSAGSLKALGQKDFQKLAINLWVFPLLLDYPIFGIGRGAFETVFPSYRQGGGDLIYQFPENIVSQWLSEWGLLAGTLGLATFCWCLRPRWLNLGREIQRHAAQLAILTLVFHNLVDLSLELSSVSTSAFAVLGALSGSADRRLKATEEPSVRLEVPALAYGIAMLVPIMAGYAFGTRSAVRERLELHEAYSTADRRSKPQANALLARVVDAIQRHPADPYFPLLAALLTPESSRRALSWIGLAIERDPQRGIPHYWLATTLFQQKMIEQGVLHVRLAVGRDVTLRDEAADLLLAHVEEMEPLLRAVPDGNNGQAFLLTLAERLKNKDRGALSRNEVLRTAIGRDPNAPRPRWLEGRALSEALERADDSTCARERRDHCLSLLRQDVAILSASPEFEVEAVVLRARYLRIIGQAAQADEWLESRCAELQAPTNCWRERVDAALASRDPTRTEEAMRAYLAVVCVETPQCAAAATEMGGLLAKRGDWTRALKYYQRAVREQPSKNSWRRFSRAARKASESEQAKEAEPRSHAAAPESE